MNKNTACMHPSRETKTSCIHPIFVSAHEIARSSVTPLCGPHARSLLSHTSMFLRVTYERIACARHRAEDAPHVHVDASSSPPPCVHRRGPVPVAPPRASSPLLPPAPAPAPVLLPVCVPSHARPAQREELRFLRRGSSRKRASISAYVCSESSVCRSRRCSRIWMRNMASWQ